MKCPRGQGEGCPPGLHLPHLERPPGEGPAAERQGPGFRIRRGQPGRQPKGTAPAPEAAHPKVQLGQGILPGLQLRAEGEELGAARHPHTPVPKPADQRIAPRLETER